MTTPGRWKSTSTIICLVVLFSVFHTSQAAGQSDATVYHQIEGRVQHRNGTVRNVRVRLLRLPEMRPIAETFSRPDGEFTFTQVTEGEYSVETFETDLYEATNTQVQVRPLPRNKPSLFTVFVELPRKAASEKVAGGELMADVDVNVPKKAVKHYTAGMKKISKRDSAGAIAELQLAIGIYPAYYAARLELGRELRLQKRFLEALQVIEPLFEIAPRRVDPLIEQGIVMLALERREDAIRALTSALSLEENNWAAHLYLGWALLEQEGAKSETHFQRAIELDERKAARAHLALARLAEARGERLLALDHLDAYLELAPEAHDAEATRKLAERLRSQP